MHKILSLPPSLVNDFNKVAGLSSEEWFATSDPNGAKVGSGGGTAWALSSYCDSKRQNFNECIFSGDKRIIIHAGGQSRRLPAYAPSGKILTPIPVFRWSRGQSITQNLLSLQMPLYERIMQQTSSSQNTLIASGDVYIYADKIPTLMPDADVVCYGIWTSPHLASNHGVFFTSRTDRQQLDFMLQKPSHAEIEHLSLTHLFLMDVGVWVLSDRALKILMKKCGWNNGKYESGIPNYYDLYSSFGTALGRHPSQKDDELSQLSVAIVTLDDGEFYHYGTSSEIISSTETIQNRVVDQRNIWHKKVKPDSSVFVMNSDCGYLFNSNNKNIWIENSYIGSSWVLTSNNIITGVPKNDWEMNVPESICIDVVPIDDNKFAIRPYGINDKFKGALNDAETYYMGFSFIDWLSMRDLTCATANLDGSLDIQSAPLFPVVDNVALMEPLLNWMIFGIGRCGWETMERISADEISFRANLNRLNSQRRDFLKINLKELATNYSKSIFYQSDLKQMAALWNEFKLPLPAKLPTSESPMTKMRDQMFRAEVLRYKGNGETACADAFKILQQTIIGALKVKSSPHCSVYNDQIVCGRAPARLDLAGGWADTPPYCMQEGGSVVNLAVELNGQPPIQVFVRLSEERCIVMRSIDNGVMERVDSYEELGAYNKIGSAFSIPKAALCLAGFYPDFCREKYHSLIEQLDAFGGGIELTLLVAIPKGSGLGTSSILASTILGALSDFCGLHWDNQQICHRTLVLEQLLTTGGGWQDQYGGVFSGVKLLESQPGQQDNISVKWLPEQLFKKEHWILYYTGITRVAKNILSEIVRGMFLNENERISIVNQIKSHAYEMAEAIQRSDIKNVGRLLRRSWELNCKLDSGTTTEDVSAIVNQIDKYALGYKLLGAGGGGYLLICVDNKVNAETIISILNQNPPNDKARFVDMTVSSTGLQISRS